MKARKLSQNDKKIYKIFYDNSPDMYASVSPDDATIIHCNETLLKNTGYSRKEIIGSPIFKMYHNESLDEAKKIFQQFKETGIIRNKDLVLKRKDGSKINVNLHVNSIRDESGEVMYSISNWRDITKSKLVEEKLHKSEQKVYSVFRAVPIGIGVVQDRNIVEVNSHFCKMTGYTEKELLGQSAMKVYPSREVYEYVGLEKYRQMSVNGTGIIETRFKKKDGSEINVLLASTQIDQNDMSKGVTFTALDITERKKSEERIIHLNSTLRTIRDIHKLIVREKNRDSLIQKSCEILTTTQSYSNAWIVLLDIDEEYRTSVENGVGKEFAQLDKMLKKGEFPFCVREALKRKELIVVKNPVKECLDCPIAYTYGENCVLTTALIHQGKIFGVLSVSLPKSIVEDKEQQSLFREVSEDICFALHSIEIGELHKEADKQLLLKDYAFESSISADSIGNNEGFLTHANPEFAKIWGYKNVDEVLGKPILDFLVDKDEALKIIELLNNTGKWKGEYTALRKDGSEFIARSTANAVYDKKGNQTALYSSVEDITDLKSAEDEIIKLKDRLEEKVAEKTMELVEKTKELVEKNKDLQRFNDAMVDRELRMKDLFDENEELKRNLEENQK